MLEATHGARIAALWIRGSYTCGELGYYARKVVQQGCIAMATANSPALMSIGGAPKRIFGKSANEKAAPKAGLPVATDGDRTVRQVEAPV